MKTNSDLRLYFKGRNLKQWTVAFILGISESTLVRWLRFELPERRKQEIINEIEQFLDTHEIVDNEVVYEVQTEHTGGLLHE